MIVCDTTIPFSEYVAVTRTVWYALKPVKPTWKPFDLSSVPEFVAPVSSVIVHVIGASLRSNALSHWLLAENSFATKGRGCPAITVFTGGYAMFVPTFGAPAAGYSDMWSGRP